MFLKVISHSFHFISRAILPTICLLCGHPTCQRLMVCMPCQSSLPILSHYCQKCAQILPFFPDSRLCGSCLKNPPPMDAAHALFPYQSPIIELITQLKFKHQLPYAKVLGQLLIEAICNQWYLNQPLPDLIIPIPLHPHRLRERGFNQALEIIRPVAKALSIPIDTKGIKRIKSTAIQSSLPADLRKQNLAQAFIAEQDYTGLSVAVADDVMTTGYTMKACCQVLRERGVKQIHSWCVARTPL